MFNLFKRKPSSPPTSRALTFSDPEVERLRTEIAAKQARAAELEADLMESRESLAAFQREYESRLGPYLRRVSDLQEKLRIARREAVRRLWESSRFSGKFVDVEEQFRKAWTQTDSGEPPPPPPPRSASVEAEIKAVYRELAKRYHPDLAATDEARQWRTPRMAAVNAAYAARDLATLQRLAAVQDDALAPQPSVDSREALIASLRHEGERLDELIERLESEFNELTYSPALQMQLDVTMGKRAGRDLMAETVADLQREIARMEAELKEIGGR